MFGWRKKNKGGEVPDAFGQTDQAHSSITVTSTSVAPAIEATPGASPAPGALPVQLGGMLGAIQEAMQESGGDPDKLREEIKENLHERGIDVQVQTSGSPAIIASTFGGAVSPEDAKLARIEKLGQLKAQGLLTEEEFQAEKAKILGT